MGASTPSIRASQSRPNHPKSTTGRRGSTERVVFNLTRPTCGRPRRHHRPFDLRDPDVRDRTGFHSASEHPSAAATRQTRTHGDANRDHERTVVRLLGKVRTETPPRTTFSPPTPNRPQAAKAAMEGLNMNRQSQSCSSPSRVFAHESLDGALLGALVAEAEVLPFLPSKANGPRTIATCRHPPLEHMPWPSSLEPASSRLITSPSVCLGMTAAGPVASAIGPWTTRAV